MADAAPTSWGSDAIAELISRLGFEFAALNPGASYRGLHDSFVNYLDDRPPRLVVALHEEHAVAIAHGWAKVTERPALAIVHSNVGLMHATMAVYNAWVDRAPVVILGATGAVDAKKRRPWIEWIHTVQDQATLVRPFTKWDDQPGSVEAALSALVQAAVLAGTPPRGPVYVCLDVTYQEQKLTAPIDVARFLPAAQPVSPEPGGPALDEAVRRLAAAQRPVILMGRVGRDEPAWHARIQLAERLGAAVLSDVRTAAGFPTAHALLAEPPGFALGATGNATLAAADVVLALDWIDLANTLDIAFGNQAQRPYVISASLDSYAQRGWVKDGYALPRVDLPVLATPDAMIRSLAARLADMPKRVPWSRSTAPRGSNDEAQSLTSDVYNRVAGALATIRRRHTVCITRLPLGWPGDLLTAADPLDYIGRDGGEGLGSGLGIAVGAALALRGTGRIPVAVIGDGDFMMGVSALWTAANQKAPLLVIVANNRVYGNDVVHQERIARERGRPVENKWIGQRLDEPAIDIAALARAQGFDLAESVTPDASIEDAVVKAADAVAQGSCALIEIIMPAIGAGSLQTDVSMTTRRTRRA